MAEGDPLAGGGPERCAPADQAVLRGGGRGHVSGSRNAVSQQPDRWSPCCTAASRSGQEFLSSRSCRRDGGPGSTGGSRPARSTSVGPGELRFGGRGLGRRCRSAERGPVGRSASVCLAAERPSSFRTSWGAQRVGPLHAAKRGAEAAYGSRGGVWKLWLRRGSDSIRDGPTAAAPAHGVPGHPAWGERKHLAEACGDAGRSRRLPRRGGTAASLRGVPERGSAGGKPASDTILC